MFYLATHSTHFIYVYMASDSERGNTLPPHGLLFPINSKCSFICTIPQTGLHISRPLYTSRVALAGKRITNNVPLEMAHWVDH